SQSSSPKAPPERKTFRAATMNRPSGENARAGRSRIQPTLRMPAEFSRMRDGGPSPAVSQRAIPSLALATKAVSAGLKANGGEALGNSAIRPPSPLFNIRMPERKLAARRLPSAEKATGAE